MKPVKHILAAVLLAAACLSPAEGAVVIALQSVSASIPSTNQVMDLTLTNSGGPNFTVGAFSFTLTVPALSGITLQDATAGTAAPYVFAGDSLVIDGLLLTSLMTAGPGTSLTASDLRLTPLAGTTLVSGDTLGIARIIFDVSGAASPGAVAAVLSDFVLSDENGVQIAISTATDGTITLSAPSGIPEPATYLTLGAGLLAFALLRRR